MIKVFIDDERNPNDVFWFQSVKKDQVSAWLSNDEFEQIIVIRNFFDFVKWIQDNKSKLDWNNVIFSFDHDLQDWHSKTNKEDSLAVQYGIHYPYGEHPDKIELTGASCLRYLLDNVEQVNVNNIDLHTKNPIAINAMKNIVNQYALLG